MRYDIEKLLSKAYENDRIADKIKPSYTLNQNTISKMRESNKMNNRKTNIRLGKVAKLAVMSGAIAIVASVTTVTYSAIKKYYSSTIEMDNGQKLELSSEVHYKSIPSDVLKVYSGKEMLWDDVKEMLGFSLLGNGGVENGNILYSTYLNDDGTVAVVDLYIPAYKRYGEPSYNEEGDIYYKSYISMMIDILDVNAEEGYVLPFTEGKDAMGGKELVASYRSEALDTEVIIYTTGSSLTASIIYDDIYYTLHGYGVTEEQMREAVEELK